MPVTSEKEAEAARLEAEIADVCGMVNAATARLVDLIGGVLATGSWEGWQIRSPEHLPCAHTTTVCTTSAASGSPVTLTTPTASPSPTSAAGRWHRAPILGHPGMWRFRRDRGSIHPVNGSTRSGSISTNSG